MREIENKYFLSEMLSPRAYSHMYFKCSLFYTLHDFTLTYVRKHLKMSFQKALGMH